MPNSTTISVDEMQEAVLKWVAEFLEVDEVSPADNFLDLGGHSLIAMQLNAQVRLRFGDALDIKELFEEHIGDAVAELHSRVTAAA